MRVTMAAAPNKSLDASGGSVFLNLLGAVKGALIRAAASTQPLGRVFLISCAESLSPSRFRYSCSQWLGVACLHSASFAAVLLLKSQVTLAKRISAHIFSVNTVTRSRMSR